MAEAMTPDRTLTVCRRGMLACLLVALLLWLCCCASPFTRYNAGIGTLYVGDRLAVEQVCRRRGVVAPMDYRVYGCTDFVAREMFSVQDPAVMAHEFCRLSLWAGTGDGGCRTPVLP